LKSLRVSGAEKIAAGLTTLDEVLRAAPPFET
jgi:type II secretory ATPase GspE/PulE/Tfp pilus assembly ATPase PilB-like protein